MPIPLSACEDARGYDRGPGGQTPPRTGLSELSFLECGLQTTIFLDCCGFKTTILYHKCGLQTTPRITLSITSAEKRLKIATLREIRKILIALPIKSPPMLVCRRFRIVRQGGKRCRRAGDYGSRVTTSLFLPNSETSHSESNQKNAIRDRQTHCQHF